LCAAADLSYAVARDCVAPWQTDVKSLSNSFVAVSVELVLGAPSPPPVPVLVKPLDVELHAPAIATAATAAVMPKVLVMRSMRRT
jgi:hypothetical protein